MTSQLTVTDLNQVRSDRTSVVTLSVDAFHVKCSSPLYVWGRSVIGDYSNLQGHNLFDF